MSTRSLRTNSEEVDETGSTSICLKPCILSHKHVRKNTSVDRGPFEIIVKGLCRAVVAETLKLPETKLWIGVINVNFFE